MQAKELNMTYLWDHLGEHVQVCTILERGEEPGLYRHNAF